MFLLHHIHTLHRKRIILSALIAQVLAFTLATMFTLMGGMGVIGPSMLLYPIAYAGIITYWVVTFQHFSLHNMRAARKAYRA